MGVGCALLAALVGVAGCGIKRIPTSGKVTLDGQPMTEGVLQFIPRANALNFVTDHPAAGRSGFLAARL